MREDAHRGKSKIQIRTKQKESQIQIKPKHDMGENAFASLRCMLTHERECLKNVDHINSKYPCFLRTFLKNGYVVAFHLFGLKPALKTHWKRTENDSMF